MPMGLYTPIDIFPLDIMANEKSGLSPKERSIVQDNGYMGIGQENDYFKMWKFRIRNKTRMTISDSLLLLKFREWVDLEDFLKNNCKNDLLELRDLINDLFPPNVETGSDMTDNKQTGKLVSKF